MRVFYWCGNSMGGNVVYRCVYPGRALSLLGHRVEVSDCAGPVGAEGQTTLELPDLNYDIYIFQVPQVEVHLECIRSANKHGRVTIVEVDDHYHSIPYYNSGRHNFERSQGDKLEIMEQCMRECDAVTVTTPELAELYSGFNENTFSLPNLIDAGDQDWRIEPEAHEDLVIGWAGSSGHTGDFNPVVGCLEQVCRRYPQVRLAIGGSSGVFELLGGIPEERKEVYPWGKFSEYPKMLSRFDIGLVPLVDNKFNRCKSELKGLEYSRLGIPFLASPLPAYRRLVTDGENGFLCERPREWTRNLSRLIESPELRRQMGSKAREVARSRDISKFAFLWENVYEALLMQKRLTATIAGAAGG